MEKHMSVYRTLDRHGYSTKFSPFCGDRLACVACDNYGISGRGRLYYLQVLPDASIECRRTFDWTDGLFDVTWCETDPDVCVTASGDGSLQVWNARNDDADAVQVLKEHTREAYSVEWCLDRRNERFASGSWDSTVRIWCPTVPHSVATLNGHGSVVYCIAWSPHISDCIASVSGDGTLRIWDLKSPVQQRVLNCAHRTEILSCDWNRYNQHVIATGATDGLIRGWDLRNPTQPVFELRGHQYAVRRVKFSPHVDSVVASVSYDFTTRLWDYNYAAHSLKVLQNHSEFVYGLDFNLHLEDQIADCGFDELVCVSKKSIAASPT